jgi:hypothetical protein
MATRQNSGTRSTETRGKLVEFGKRKSKHPMEDPRDHLFPGSTKGSLALKLRSAHNKGTKRGSIAHQKS